MNQLKSRFVRQLPLIAATFVVAVASTATSAWSANKVPVAVRTDSVPRPPKLYDRDTLGGLSGKLWMKVVPFQPGDSTGLLARLFGDSVARTPGTYLAPEEPRYASPFTFVSLVPFSEKKKGMLGDYRMGSWPAERRDVSDRYDNPAGFIRVTPENRDWRVSEHFRLGDFLTKDQFTTWPKYLVLQERLVDKLELVIGALNKRGVNVMKLSVMSGFRTPQYNEKGVGAGGRSEVSRHQYGDAADVYVDNDYSGSMDDINGDGRVTIADAQFLAQVADQVEKEHPELTGGVGIYQATGAHGPFVHIDVRGVKARW